LIIADGLCGENLNDIQIDKKHFNSVKVGHKSGRQHDSPLSLQRDLFSGFGGAIKNLAMGCTPAAGKAD
jgi:uncharacterized Fe-S center protein